MDTSRILALACSLAGVVLPQSAPPSPIDRILLPIPGAPLSLEAVGITEDTLPDGTVMTFISRGEMYRDSAGRTRSEATIPWPSPAEGAPLGLTRIEDPVTGLVCLLEEPSRTAYRLPDRKYEPSNPLGFGFFVGSELQRETGEKTHHDETLGKRMIEGVEFEGSRITTTVVEKPFLKEVEEHWISKDLGLIGMIVTSSPKRKTRVTIYNVVRQEPDPSLFVVPPDYTIVHLGAPDGRK